MRSRIAGVCALALVLASCSGQGTEPARPKPPVVIPTPEDLPFGVVHTATLSPGEAHYYRVKLDGSAFDLAVLYGLTGPVGLTSHGSDSTFQANDCTHAPEGLKPSMCGLLPTGPHAYLTVRAAAGTQPASYRLFVHPGRGGSGAPQSEGTSSQPVEIVPGSPHPGSLGDDFLGSFYHAGGLDPVVAHAILLFGFGEATLTGVGLTVTGVPDSLGRSGAGVAEYFGIMDSTVSFQSFATGLWGTRPARYWVLVD